MQRQGAGPRLALRVFFRNESSHLNVDIDEQCLERLGQWPWPRDMPAGLVDRLHAAGAAAGAFDFIFAEPDRLSPSRLNDG